MPADFITRKGCGFGVASYRIKTFSCNSPWYMLRVADEGWSVYFNLVIVIEKFEIRFENLDEAMLQERDLAFLALIFIIHEDKKNSGLKC